MAKPRQRYDLRKDTPDTWEVYDTRTGKTVVVGGKPRVGLKLDEADIYVDLLNSGDQIPDGDMSAPKSANRYGMRKNEGDEWWTVYDITTGLAAVVNDTTLDSCEIEEADDLVDLLNAQYIARRGGTMH